MSEINPCEFTDARGDRWILRVTTKVLIEAGSELGITLSELQNLDRIKLNVLGIVWLCCKNMAGARGVSKNEFETERLTPANLSSAITALGSAMALAFKVEDAENPQKDQPEILAIGKSGI